MEEGVFLPSPKDESTWLYLCNDCHLKKHMAFKDRYISKYFGNDVDFFLILQAQASYIQTERLWQAYYQGVTACESKSGDFHEEKYKELFKLWLDNERKDNGCPSNENLKI
jgi:hypothetical protein